MLNNIFISTSAFGQKKLKDVLNWCLENNYMNLELGSTLEFSQDNVETVIDYYKKSMNFLLHNYFPRPKDDFVLNLASDDSEVLEKSIALCKKAIDLSEQIKAPFYSVHAGFALHAAPENLGSSLAGLRRIPIEEAYGIFLKSTRILSLYAAEKQVKFAVENNVISEYSLIDPRDKALFLLDADEMLKFHKEVSSNNLFFLIDTGHLKVNSFTFSFSREDFLNKVKPYTIAYHLNENDGRNDYHGEFNKDTWFKDIAKEEKDKFFIIETHGLGQTQLKQCYDTVGGFLC